MDESRICELTISEYHEKLRTGEMSCVSLVKAYIERIKAYDKTGPCINAIIHLNENALDEAARLDAFYRQEGLSGPLHGVPVLMKDNVETVDMPTTAGSKSLLGYMPKQDAEVVRKLREAGALILAKTNLHEFALWGETISSILGQTRNPYDLTRTPGGSSGGTGASVSASFGMVGIGTDTINSIRSPASANNLVGIRPTGGLVSLDGVVPYSHTQDVVGPICRTLEDAVRTLEVIQEKYPPGTLTAHLIKEGLQGGKIGVLRSFFGSKAEHVQTNNAMISAMEVLNNSGAELIMLDEAIDSKWLTEKVSVHLFDLRDHLDAYLNTLPESASVHSYDELVASGLYHEGIEELLKKSQRLSTSSEAYEERLAMRETIRRDVLKLMDDHELDALIYPHQKQLVCKTGKSQNERNGALSSVTGFPSICVPAGFSTPTETAALGIPVGMELLGRPGAEARLVELAYGYEQSARIRKPPASTPELNQSDTRTLKGENNEAGRN